MESSLHFKAPWGPFLIIMSSLVTILLLAIALFVLTRPDQTFEGKLIVSLIQIMILGGALLFTVRGYFLFQDTLYIKRLFWNSAVSLADIESVNIDPDAMKGSIRTFGNGGLYSFSGLFRNSKIGRYRAYATDHKRAVVLKFDG